MNSGARDQTLVAGGESAIAPRDRMRGWFISLLFWLSLLVASTLFSSVALAPKLMAFLHLKQEFHSNQIKLVRLQSRVRYLGRVAEAFRNEPEFAAELIRADFGTARPGEERIAVDAKLSLGAETADSMRSLPAPVLPWFTPLVKRFAEHNTLRVMTLASVTLLILLIFTFLHEPQSAQFRRGTDSTEHILGSFIRRYSKPVRDA